MSFFNFTSSILNDQNDDDGLPLVIRDGHCGGCGQKVVYGIRYKLCNPCLTRGNPAKSVHKTTKDRLTV